MVCWPRDASNALPGAARRFIGCTWVTSCLLESKTEAPLNCTLQEHH